MERLKALSAKWRDAAVWEYDMGNTQSAYTFDQCADELDAVLSSLASRAVPSTGEATDLMLGDLEYWRKFLLRARSRAGETQEAPVHIDHLTAAALCIGNVLKLLKSAAPSDPPAPAASSGAAPQDESLRVMHARKQGAADGFQQGWRGALARVKAGDSVSDLLALIPSGPRLPVGVTEAIAASMARIYPDADYERYLDEIVGSTVTVLEDLEDEHAQACIRQLTEALHALRRSRDELRADAVRVALAIREAREAPPERPTTAAPRQCAEGHKAPVPMCGACYVFDWSAPQGKE